MTELLTWLMPGLLGLLGWFVHDLIQTLRNDVKALKKDLREIELTLKDHDLHFKTVTENIKTLASSADKLGRGLSRIDERVSSISGNEKLVAEIESQKQSILKINEDYGKVLTIVKKLIERSSNKPSP